MNDFSQNYSPIAAVHLQKPRLGTARTTVLLVISLFLLALSIYVTVASVLVGRALNSAEPSTTTEVKPTYASGTPGLLVRATDLNSLDADAWLFRAKFFSGADHDLTAAAAENLPSAYYIYALRLRPHSGSLWAEYAEYGLQARLSNSETLARLDRALAFAPFKPRVRRIEVKIGLALWDDISRARQAQVLASINYLLPRNRRFIINTAVTHDWADNLRPLLTGDGQLRQLDQALAKQAMNDATNPQ